jgi:hypothetical protein
VRHRLNTPQVIAETIDGEAIMIDLATGNYYSVRGCGADICTLLEAGASTDEIVAALLELYDADRSAVELAVETLIGELEQEQLVTSTDGDGKGPPPLPAGRSAKAPFLPPTFEKYTDMQDLVLLDPVHEVDERGWPHARA